MHDEPEDDPSHPELTDDEKALLEEMPSLTDLAHTRRTFLGASFAGGWGSLRSICCRGRWRCRRRWMRCGSECRRAERGLGGVSGGWGGEDAGSRFARGVAR
jgi:hypothetical protein